MKESISTKVMISDEEQELTLVLEDNVLDFQIEGEKVFGGDWHGNLEKVFWEALKRWGCVGE